MKNQVLSIEQMRHLQKLGVDTSKASMMYHFWVGKKYQNCFLLSVDIATPHDSENVPTFTLQNMLEMMPPYFYSFPFEDKERYVIHYMVMEKLTGKWFIGYTHGLIKGKLIIKFHGDFNRNRFVPQGVIFEAFLWVADKWRTKTKQKRQ